MGSRRHLFKWDQNPILRGQQKMEQDEKRGLTKRNLINSYVASITAQNDKDILKAVKLSKSFEKRLKKYEVKSCKYEAQRILNSIGI